MKGKRILDFCITVLAFAVSGISLFYFSGWQQFVIASSAMLLALFFFIMAVLGDRAGKKKTLPSKPAHKITELALLSEENTILASWDIYGKTGLVIGRDVGENHVDINLSTSTYASLIEIEHAVLNYTSEGWMVEDLGSHNGVSIQKAADGRKYRLAPDKPCRLEQGDIIYIAMTRLFIR